MEAEMVHPAGAILVESPHEHRGIHRSKDDIGVVRIEKGGEKVDDGEQHLRPEDAPHKHGDRGHLFLPILVEVPDVCHHLVGRRPVSSE